MDENKHIDELFSSKLRDFTKDPPADVWNSVLNSLNHKNRILLLRTLWKIAAGIAILLMTGLGWYIINKRVNDIPVINAEDQSKDKSNELKSETDNSIFEERVSEFPLKHKVDDEKVTSVELDRTTKHEFQAVVEKTSVKPGIDKSDLIYVQKDDMILTLTGHDIQDEYLTIPIWSVMADEITRITPPAANREFPALTWKQKDAEDTLLLRYYPEYENNISLIEGRWILSGMAAPEYSYRTLNMNDMAFLEYFNNTESAALTWSGGLQIGYKATRRLNVQTGVLYSRLGVHIDHLSTFGKIAPESFFGNYSGITTKAFVNTGNSIGSISTASSNVVYMSYNTASEQMDRSNSGSTIINTVDMTSSLTGLDAGLTQYFDFIEIPFNLRYRLNDGKIQLNLLGGVSSNLLIGNQVFFSAGGEKEKAGKTANIRNVSYSGNLGLSVDYNINDHFMLLVEPRFKHYLHSINQNDLIHAKPYLIGIFTGIRYSFN